MAQMEINKDLVIEGTEKSLGTTVSNIIGLQGTILWTNNNASSNFDSQTVSVDLSNYDEIIIVYKSQVSESTIFFQKILKGWTIEMTRAWNSGNGIVCMFMRTASASSTGVFFSVCTRVREGVYESDHNEGIIPLYIIGYKTGLFN